MDGVRTCLGAGCGWHRVGVGVAIIRCGAIRIKEMTVSMLHRWMSQVQLSQAKKGELGNEMAMIADRRRRTSTRLLLQKRDVGYRCRGRGRCCSGLPGGWQETTEKTGDG